MFRNSGKTLARVMTAVLTLALLAMPMAGLAEGASKLYTFTLGDVVFGMGEGSPLTFDFSGMDLVFSGGFDEAGERGLGSFALMVNGAAALQAIAAYEDKDVTAVVDGLSKVIKVPEKMLTEAMTEVEAGVEVEGAETGASEPDMQAVFENFGKMMASLEKLEAGEVDEAALNAEMEKIMAKHFGEPTQEEIEVMGTKGNAEKYTFNLDEQQTMAFFQEAMDAMSAVPAFKEYMDAYLAMLSEVSGFTVTDFATLCEQMGLSVAMEGAMWTIGEEVGKMEMKLTETIKDAESGETVTLPITMTMEVVMDGEEIGKMTMAMAMDVAADGETVTMTMDMSADTTETGETVVMNMNMDLGGEGAMDMTFNLDGKKAEGSEEGKASFTMKLSGAVAGEAEALAAELDDAIEQPEDAAEPETAEELATVDFTMDYSLSEAQEGKDGAAKVTAQLSVTAEGETVKFDAAYDGTSSLVEGMNASEGTVKLGMDAMGQVFSASARVACAEEAMPAGQLLDVSGMSVLDLSEATEEEMTALTTELQAVLTASLPKLQQVPAINMLMQFIMAPESTPESTEDQTVIGGADGPTAVYTAEPEEDPAA